MKTPEAFVERLRAEGARRYHDRHPFHARMHAGELSKGELRAWVANRFYYQTRIPIKDALILSKSEDPAFRRTWRQRIADHDGESPDDGGLAKWRALARAVGLNDAELLRLGRVHPGVRFACDAYVELVRQSSLVEAVASSVTECFAPDLMERRVEAWTRHYSWVEPGALDYFRSRVPRAKRDGDFALAFVVEHAKSADIQDRCVDALVKKTEILWHMLDCIELQCRQEPGR